MKKTTYSIVILTATLMWTSLPISADFVQCNGGCVGSVNNDIYNGTENQDVMTDTGGNDVFFGLGEFDVINDTLGNDIMFGGAGSDILTDTSGNNVFFPGPDDMNSIQVSSGGIGQDTFNLFVGETVNCNYIFGSFGLDVLNLIGFGPYSVTSPFGLTEDPESGSFIVVQDPVGGGWLLISIEPEGDDVVEVINGLPNPSLAVLNNADSQAFIAANCMDI